ncbi:transporter substrate-binding domain-containing protein [Teredinibacter haidensis]|uniref:transporter substrate-binding domain-containing protein n=1 Tax=Teredinibacter haidensis TaxID=2731755 RepID=UPI000948CD04|nr:transporter substrate-binding domain-containing protein [Teredinibacter haidensis]
MQDLYLRLAKQYTTRNCLAVLLILIWPVTLHSVAEDDQTTPMTYRYWDWGQTPERDDYQFELLNLALDKTLDTYGPYHAHRIKRHLSAARAMREVNTGTLINVRVAPWVDENATFFTDADLNEAVRFPLLQNLLGYRQLIIRQNESAFFDQLYTVDALKMRVAGQGSMWVDTHIYRHNGFAINDSGTTPFLLAMLANKRIDYVPMSVIEIDSLLKPESVARYKVTAAKDILIFYPFPIVFMTNRNQPELAARLEEGLAKAKLDGSFEALFDRYYADLAARLPQQQNRIFTLENPFIAPESAPKTAQVKPD